MAKKPVDRGREPTEAKPKFDPFEDPAEELLVARVPASDPTHNLVLNKYPVIPKHFILATKANKPQTDLLDPEDLATAFACLQAWRDDHRSIPSQDNDILAFFNSGPHSGASQPHRHIQFISTTDMKHGIKDYEKARQWKFLLKYLRTPHPLAKSLPQMLKHDPRMPFLVLTVPVHDNMATPSELYNRYLFLLRAAKMLMKDPSTSDISSADLESVDVTDPPDSRHVAYSYNLALTLQQMTICPRMSETAPIPGLNGNEVAPNGTILAGTLLVKHVEEWDALKRADGTQALDDMLAHIGFPSTAYSASYG